MTLQEYVALDEKGEVFIYNICHIIADQSVLVITERENDKLDLISLTEFVDLLGLPLGRL
jgi:hypothetical protein